TAMFLANPTTGALYLWTSLAFDLTTGQLTFTPYTLKASGWAGASGSLQAADINGDGTPDIWSVGDGGGATAYMVGGLSGGPGALTPQPAQTLLTGNHAWKLDDTAAGTVTTATDALGTASLTAGGNATGQTGDVFSPDVVLNLDASGAVDRTGTG